MIYCFAYLPAHVKYQDIARAVALAAGAIRNVETSSLTGQPNMVVPSLVFKATPPTLQTIIFSYQGEDGDTEECDYNFEIGSQGERGLVARSTPRWIAIFKKVVDTFGGGIYYGSSNTEEQPFDYVAPTRPQSADYVSERRQVQALLESIDPVAPTAVESEKEHATYSD